MDYFNQLAKPIEFKTNPVSRLITATGSSYKENTSQKVQ